MKSTFAILSSAAAFAYILLGVGLGSIGFKDGWWTYNLTWWHPWWAALIATAAATYLAIDNAVNNNIEVDRESWEEWKKAKPLVDELKRHGDLE